MLGRINSTLMAMRDHIDSYLVLDTGSNDTTAATVRRKLFLSIHNPFLLQRAPFGFGFIHMVVGLGLNLARGLS